MIACKMGKQTSIPLDKELYEQAMAIVYAQYRHPSAYRSGALVKKYKELGGRYGSTKSIQSIDERPLKRWFEENWQDIGHKGYPVYRPTKRVTSKTPLTPVEIDPANMEHQIKLKQKIKGTKNLKPFKPVH
jgi:hypothetical protein